MIQTFYSSGKEKEGGYSGILIFESPVCKLNISRGSSVSYKPEYKRAIHVDFEPREGIKFEYIIYDDDTDFKYIQEFVDQIKTDEHSNVIISRKIVKYCLKKIVKTPNFNIVSIMNVMFDAGLIEGRKQKVQQFKDWLLNE
jgi:hypothetical protein